MFHLEALCKKRQSKPIALMIIVKQIRAIGRRIKHQCYKSLLFDLCLKTNSQSWEDDQEEIEGQQEAHPLLPKTEYRQRAVLQDESDQGSFPANGSDLRNDGHAWHSQNQDDDP
jgi:hypothetical protein